MRLRLNPHSLWMRMLGLTVGLVLMVGGVVGAGAIYMVYKAEKDHMLEVGSNLVHLGAVEMDSQAQGALREMQELSRSPHLQNQVGLSYFIEKSATESEILDGMVYLSPTGKTVAAYPESSLLGKDLSDREYVKHIFDGYAYDITDAYTGYTGKKLIAIAVPVRKNDGTLNGILVGGIYLNNENPAGRIFGRMNYGLKGQVYVVDHQGTILFHPNSERLFQSGKDDPAVRAVMMGQTGSIESEREGTRWLSVYQPIPNLGWGVIAEVPLRDAFEAIRLTLMWILGITIVSMSVAVLITLLVLQRIYTPIKRLNKAMHHVATGDLSVRAECTGQDEIAHCAHSFNWMLDELERRANEEHRAEAQLRQAEKLAVVGELAAGTAHEIRNPLTVVKGYAQILNRNLAGTVNHEFIQIMLGEIARIERIVTDFMLLAKPPQLWEAIDVNTLVRDVWRLVDYQEGLVKPAFVFEEEGLLVRGDPQQLKQVFLNLVNNAIQAIKTEGTLTFSTWREGEHVLVALKDTGMGIPPEHLEKIGQPFFTTKESGTGLGLMVSYRIVQHHSGKIDVKSEVGKGTIFTLSFPMF